MPRGESARFHVLGPESLTFPERKGQESLHSEGRGVDSHAEIAEIAEFVLTQRTQRARSPVAPVAGGGGGGLPLLLTQSSFSHGHLHPLNQVKCRSRTEINGKQIRFETA